MSMANVIPLNAWRGKLDIGEKGVKRNLTNLILHLQNIPGISQNLKFNELTMQPEWMGAPMTDEHVIDMRLIVERNEFQPTVGDFYPAVMRVAHDNSYNPVTDYLSGLVWDGVNRLERWLPILMGAPDTAFVRCIGPKVLISAVARAFDPGCQVDTMLVLEGSQGVRKSSAVQTLFGGEHTYEVVSGFDDHRKLANSVIGAWAVELAEFVSVTKSHSGNVKGLITMRRDRVQLPYGKRLSDLPRRFVFIGTINPTSLGYLTDDTGNRRYWPVTVTKVDIDKIARKRDQLWAEAVHRYKEKERWWMDENEDAAAKQETSNREESDPWEEVLLGKMRRDCAGMGIGPDITSDDALTALAIPHERKDKRAQMRVSACLKKIGYERKKVRIGTRSEWRWVFP